MYRNTCSMPDNSAAAGAYYNAASQWSHFNSLMDWNWSYDDCSITFLNGRSETAVVPYSEISGNDGLTEYWYNPATCEYTEADVKIADTVSFDAPDESYLGFGGWGVTVHEFGHVFGLDHSEGFDVMRALAPWPLVGGTGDHDEPLPDDAMGVRALYRNYPTQYNVFASAQEFYDNGTNDGAIQPVAQDWPSTVCPNDPITVYYTFGNNGTVGLGNIGYRIFLNNVSPRSAPA